MKANTNLILQLQMVHVQPATAVQYTNDIRLFQSRHNLVQVHLSPHGRICRRWFGVSGRLWRRLLRFVLRWCRTSSSHFSPTHPSCSEGCRKLFHHFLHFRVVLILGSIFWVLLYVNKCSSYLRILARNTTP